MKRFLIGAALALVALSCASPSQAQTNVCSGGGYVGMIVGGTVADGCPYLKVNPDGSINTTASAGSTGDVNLKQVNGATTNVGVGAAGTGTQRVTTSTDSTIGPAQRTIVALDASSVTTGGTAVTALTAGHRTAGGFLYNPIGATINLCINEQGTASGTTSAGALTCIQPGQSYTLTPAAGAVSVVTSDSTHPFSGQGLN